MQLLQWNMAQAQLVVGKDVQEDVLELSVNEEFLGEAMKEEEDDKVVEPRKSLTGATPCPVDSCPRTFTKQISLMRHWQRTHVKTTTLFHYPIKDCR